MLEPTKQQQLDAALAGWVESWDRASQIRLASLVGGVPASDAQEALRLSVTCLEGIRKKLNDVSLEFASTIAMIPDVKQREKLQQGFTGIVTGLNVIADRALNGETESRPARYEWIRNIRATWEKNGGRAARHDVLNTVDQLVVSHLAFIQESLLQPDGGAAALALESAVAEPQLGEAGFPRCWEILAYLLPRDSRQRIYEPNREELLEDYLLSRSCRRGWWSRLAVNSVFLVRTLLLAGECGRVLFTTRVVQFWLWVVGLVLAWVRFMLR